METGVPGVLFHLAVSPAEEAFRITLDFVTIQHPIMVDPFALDIVQKMCHAIYINVLLVTNFHTYFQGTGLFDRITFF
jgi:hypothetical protein